MALARRQLPGMVLTEKVGPKWRNAVKHTMFTDLYMIGSYEYDIAEFEKSYMAVREAGNRELLSVVPNEDLLALYTLSVILWYMHGIPLFSDNRYRRIDKLLFHNIGRMTNLGAVTRDTYLQLWTFRTDHGGPKKSIYSNLGAVNAVCLCKNPRRFWIRKPRK